MMTQVGTAGFIVVSLPCRYYMLRVSDGAKKINRGTEKSWQNQRKKRLQSLISSRIISLAVTLIAVKREVAARQRQVFPWSECQVRKLATSHCNTQVCKIRQKRRVSVLQETHGRVEQSPLVVLRKKSAKRRRLFLWQVR